MAIVNVQKSFPQALHTMMCDSRETLAITNSGASSVVAAFSFRCPKIMASGYFKSIELWVGAVSGSPTLTGYLYTDNGAVPGSLIEAGSITASPTGAGFVTLSGFTSASALTDGTVYWVVVKCTAGTNATLYYGLVGASSFIPQTYISKIHSTDNGSTWTGTYRLPAFGFVIAVTDGTDTAYFGSPIFDSKGAKTQTTELLYTNGGVVQEGGTKFTMLANVSFVLKAVSMFVRKQGSPSGDLRVRIYDDTALVATSMGLPPALISTSGVRQLFHFSTPYTLIKGRTYRIVAGNSAADSSSNCYYIYTIYHKDDDIHRSLIPMNPTCYTIYSGGSWIDSTTHIQDGLILLGDTDGEYVSPDFPAVGNVTEDDTVNGAQGTYHEPTVAEVEAGVTFGADEELTGTLENPTDAEIAQAVWEYGNRTLT